MSAQPAAAKQQVPTRKEHAAVTRCRGCYQTLTFVGRGDPDRKMGWDCDRIGGCRCTRGITGECGCVALAVKSPSAPTRQQRPSDAEYTMHLRQMPKADLRELAAFLAKSGSRDMANVVRSEVQRRNMRVEQRMLLRDQRRLTLVQSLEEAQHNSVGAAMLLAVMRKAGI